ncbi:hypothetical protein [uncultured Alistipes sp.]|jgi:hypothetical protein|uniref:hypothetical protein n=1 Tax=uncultured Alistipes sp. TaxID=538949 RepID=UPI0025D4A81A|nr:hypothetical protein [uncultured Alistipes sp.]
MKKIFSFVIVLAAVAMVGCGGNANKKAAADAEQASACTECVENADAEKACCGKECGEGESCCAEKSDSTKCCGKCDSEKACDKGEGECCKEKKAEGECCKDKK